MSDRVQSALQGATFDGIAQVREAGACGMITVRGDFASATFRKAVAAVAEGAELPAQRGIVSAGESAVAWMSPDELLVMCPHTDAPARTAALAEALKGEHALAVNVSDARAVFDIRGVAAREVLAKLCPVDFAPGAFGEGEIRRTRMAQVAAAVWMTGPESFRIVCFRSVATYVFGLLSAAAAEGSGVGVFRAT